MQDIFQVKFKIFFAFLIDKPKVQMEIFLEFFIHAEVYRNETEKDRKNHEEKGNCCLNGTVYMTWGVVKG